MAWTKSGIYVNTLMGQFTGVVFTGMTSLNLTTAANYKLALHSNSLTDGTAPINFSATSVPWANTSEITGTGWAAGGILLSTIAAGGSSAAPTVAEGTVGSLRYDMNDVSVASTTLSLARGCIIYADAITGPTGPPNYSKAMIVAVTFGADYSTSSGTFGIQWSATGVFEIDTTP